MTTGCRTTIYGKTVKNGSVFRSLTSGQVGGTGGVVRGHKIVGYWLMGCCGMVVGSVVIGGCGLIIPVEVLENMHS